MNTLNTLYFPGTEIYSGSQYPLFLLFQPIHILSPVEPDDPTEDGADIFNSSGFCQVHTPCPLGENRKRFLHLVQDIQYRKDDYAAQLSALTVASMSAPKRQPDDSQRSIVTSLLGGHGLTPTPDSDHDKETQLWQARLVLKIAEILDREEEDVAMQLALLDDQESDLFMRLQGEMEDEEETLFDELKQLRQKMNRPSTAAIRNRLNAWKQLFLAGPLPDIKIWATQSDDTAAILLEKHEDRAGNPANIIMELDLPANIGWDKEEAIESIKSFRLQNWELSDKLAETIQSGNTTAAHTTPLTQEWRTALDAAFPAEQYGRATLTVYSLEALSCATLLGATQETDNGNLLAVVRQQD